MVVSVVLKVIMNSVMLVLNMLARGKIIVMLFDWIQSKKDKQTLVYCT